MYTSIDIRSISPLPIVNLDEIAPPADGLLVSAPSSCAKNFTASDDCLRHYEALAADGDPGKLVQCPHGFSSCLVKVGGARLALTGLIPFPRIGGEKERRMGKRHPESKMTIDAVSKAASVVQRSFAAFAAIETDTIQRQSVALHEIRKLNAKVKQTAERMCSENSPGNADGAESRLVQIWKSAELMSQQFEVIELLANEGLAALPLNTVSEVYRIFDKCIRIYAQTGYRNQLDLSAPYGYSGRIRACDKTLPIIPSALIENALKYSVRDSKIWITVGSENGSCVVRVTNLAKAAENLDARVFDKGVRLSSDNEGTGNGLYLVKLVTTQHGGTIGVSVKPNRTGVDEITFKVALPEYRAP